MFAEDYGTKSFAKASRSIELNVGSDEWKNFTADNRNILHFFIGNKVSKRDHKFFSRPKRTKES